MLLNHLDAKAKEQIVGFENEYEQAMDELENYYNDAKKIIKAFWMRLEVSQTLLPLITRRL